MIKLKENRKLLLIILMVPTVLIGINVFLEATSIDGCARIIKTTGSRGTPQYLFRYKVGATHYSGGVYQKKLKPIGIDSLKKIECIKIKYCKYFPLINSIEDKRVLR